MNRAPESYSNIPLIKNLPKVGTGSYENRGLQKPLYSDDRLEWSRISTVSQEQAMLLKKHRDWRTFEPSSRSNTLNREILILREKLKVWQELLTFHNWPDIDRPGDIMYHNLMSGPDYALKKKKEFDYSFRESISLTNVLTPEDVKTYTLEGLDHLYPTRHLIPFEIPKDYSDLTDWSFSAPEVKISPSLQEELYENMKDPKVPFRFFDELDSIELSNSRKGISKGKKDYSYKLRSERGFPTDLAHDDWRYEISWTSKSADEGRLIGIADIPTKNITNIIRENVSTIHNCKYDVYGKPRWSFEKFLMKGVKDRFFMVDQSKSGWTFPMELMQLYFETVKLRHPDMPYIDTAIRIFKEKRLTYLIEGEARHPLRGFCLGMWDNVMSYIIACMFSDFKKTELNDIDEELINMIQAKFWGDDQIIHSPIDDPHIPIIVWNRWLRYCSRHGLVLNTKKSFISNVGVFCEVYGTGHSVLLEKGVMYALQPLNSLRGLTTYQRKTYWTASADLIGRAIPWFCSRHRDKIRELCQKTLSFCRETIGWEFNSFEWNLPYQLGGWEIHRNEDGDPSLFQYLKEKNIPEEYMRVALSSSSLSPKRVINSIFSELSNDKFFNEIMDGMTIGKNHADLSSYIKGKFIKLSWDKIDKRVNDARFIHKVSMERQKAFHGNYRVTKKQLIDHLYAEGNFREEPVNIDLLIKKERDQILGWYPQEPFKGITIPPHKAARLYQSITKNVMTEVRYTKEIPLKNLMASVYWESSQMDSMIPFDWYLWSIRNKVNLNTLYRKYKEFGYNIFEYFPPYMLTEELGEIAKYSKYLIYWDNCYGIPVLITEDEAIMLSTGNKSARDKVMSDVLDMEIEAYWQISEFRTGPPDEKEDDSEMELQEELALLSKIEEQYVPKPDRLRELATKYAAVRSLDELMAELGEDDYYESDESKSHHSGEGDTSLDYLKKWGIEDVDLLGIGGVDEWDNG